MASFNVKLKSSSKFKVVSNIGGVQVPASFSDLIDFDDGNSGNGVIDQYVLMYDASSQKWIAKNPDEVLQSAALEPVQPGLVNPDQFGSSYADDFVDEIQRELDPNIDGGTF